MKSILFAIGLCVFPFFAKAVPLFSLSDSQSRLQAAMNYLVKNSDDQNRTILGVRLGTEDQVEVDVIDASGKCLTYEYRVFKKEGTLWNSYSVGHVHVIHDNRCKN